MLKQTITFMDYNDQERTMDFYFNLNQAELTEMELSTEGGLVEYIQRIVKSNDGAEIMRSFKDILLKAYGEKSPDGLRFVKSEELSIAFSQTEAYNQIFVRLTTDPEAAAAFVNGVVPKALKEKALQSINEKTLMPHGKDNKQ